jgi:hypothetical protein
VLHLTGRARAVLEQLQPMSAIVAIVVAAAIGAISGIVTTSWKTRKDLESQYDIDLRKQRIDAYRALWKDLQPLAYYSPPTALTYGGLQTLSESLRRWYFEEGGLFLSERTRPPYFHLQQALTELPAASERKAHMKLDDDTAEIVKALASRLRTSTTEDVATRVRSRLGPSSLGPMSLSPSSLVRRWRDPRKPVLLSVDRRWEWAHEGINPAYFVLIVNRSGQEIEVAELSLKGVDAPALKPPLPFVVQAHEEREVTVKPGPHGIKVGQVPDVTITLSSGERINAKGAEAPPEIPIATKALRLPAHDSPSAGPRSRDGLSDQRRNRSSGGLA